MIWSGVKRSIDGMSVVITGASAGIGAALARGLSARGANLTLGARRVDRIEALNTELGGRHLVVASDVGVPADCAKLVEAAFAKWGRIDVLVCNAGYGEMRPVAEMTPELIRKMFDVNVIGTTECIRVALPRMLQQEPRNGHRSQVMMVSSGAARRGLPLFGVYSATKASQLSIAEALRVELHNTGVAVTTVHPVGTRTEFFEVAEQKGGRKMPPRMPGDVTQTADQVAAKMIRAIERPTREVWPFWPARYALSLATLWPGLGDRIMIRARGKMGEES